MQNLVKKTQNINFSNVAQKRHDVYALQTRNNISDIYISNKTTNNNFNIENSTKNTSNNILEKFVNSPIALHFRDISFGANKATSENNKNVDTTHNNTCENVTFLGEEQSKTTEREKIKFCSDIISEYEQRAISFSENSKFKIKDQITGPSELLQKLETLRTPYDTEEIIKERARYLVAGKLEIQGNKKMYGLKNHPTIGKILENATDEIKNAKKEKKLFVITGNSASGKSTYCKENGLTKENGYFLVDSDEIKKLLPYYDELGNNFTHDVSALIACAELALATENEANIVFPTTGIGKIAIEMASKKGYTIELMHCNLSIDKCMERSMNRFKKEKRFVDPSYIIENDGTLEKIKNLAKELNITLTIKEQH